MPHVINLLNNSVSGFKRANNCYKSTASAKSPICRTIVTMTSCEDRGNNLDITLSSTIFIYEILVMSRVTSEFGQLLTAIDDVQAMITTLLASGHKQVYELLDHLRRDHQRNRSPAHRSIVSR